MTQTTKTREDFHGVGFIDTSGHGLIRAYSFERSLGVGPFATRTDALMWLFTYQPFRPRDRR